MVQWGKLWLCLRQFFCDHYPRIRYTRNRVWLECEKCGKKTLGWDMGREIARLGNKNKAPLSFFQRFIRVPLTWMGLY